MNISHIPSIFSHSFCYSSQSILYIFPLQYIWPPRQHIFGFVTIILCPHSFSLTSLLYLLPLPNIHTSPDTTPPPPHSPAVYYPPQRNIIPLSTFFLFHIHAVSSIPPKYSYLTSILPPAVYYSLPNNSIPISLFFLSHIPAVSSIPPKYSYISSSPPPAVYYPPPSNIIPLSSFFL